VPVLDQASFPALPSSVRPVRQLVARALTTANPDIVDLAVLLSSELATNAVLHAGTAFRVRIELTGSRLRVEVTDTGERMPVVKRYGPESPTGRGLRLLESGAARWGVEQRPDGKTVWFELDSVLIGQVT
jgi:anti-sigma regulatory factor (Ser/Thr protein kinase)